MQTVTVDIINSNALRLLQDMELLQLIRMHRKDVHTAPPVDWAAKYKGAMAKQPLADVDYQLSELRNSWVY